MAASTKRTVGLGSGKIAKSGPAVPADYNKATPPIQANPEFASPEQQVATVNQPFRQTEPRNWQPFASGGTGVIARRAPVDPIFGQTYDSLQEYASTYPMRLLSLLPDIHPSVGLALWNALRLSCPRDGFKLQVYKKQIPGQQLEPDISGQQAIDAFWAQLPPEIGGLNGFQTQLTIQGLFTGLMTVEVVPDAVLKGLHRAWPVDSLSIWFARWNRNDDLWPYQRQRFPAGLGVYAGPQAIPKPPPGAPSGPAGMPAILGGAFVPLNKENFMWRAIDSLVDDPYGRAPYGAALQEAIADLALMQDLRDAIHNAAWPRLEVGVDLQGLHKVAVEIYRISDPKKAADWVNERFQEVVSYVGQLNSSDNIVHSSTGTVKNMAPGGWNGLQEILVFLRSRIVQALKTLPSLLGVGENTTQFTSVEWTIYVEGLENLRGITSDIIEWVGNQHLRRIGSTSYCKALYDKIKTNDALVEANTKAVQILNATNEEKLGYITHDEGSMKVVDHIAAGPAQPGVIEPLIDATDPQGVSSPTTTSDKNHPGKEIKGPRNNGNTGKKNIQQNPANDGEDSETKNTQKNTRKIHGQNLDHSIAYDVLERSGAIATHSHR